MKASSKNVLGALAAAVLAGGLLSACSTSKNSDGGGSSSGGTSSGSTCGAAAAACTVTSECCTGLSCTGGACTAQCGAAGDSCSAAVTCCSPLVCDSTSNTCLTGGSSSSFQRLRGLPPQPGPRRLHHRGQLRPAQSLPPRLGRRRLLRRGDHPAERGLHAQWPDLHRHHRVLRWQLRGRQVRPLDRLRRGRTGLQCRRRLLQQLQVRAGRRRRQRQRRGRGRRGRGCRGDRRRQRRHGRGPGNRRRHDRNRRRPDPRCGHAPRLHDPRRRHLHRHLPALLRRLPRPLQHHQRQRRLLPRGGLDLPLARRRHHGGRLLPRCLPGTRAATRSTVAAPARTSSASSARPATPRRPPTLVPPRASSATSSSGSAAILQSRTPVSPVVRLASPSRTAPSPISSACRSRRRPVEPTRATRASSPADRPIRTPAPATASTRS